MQHTIANVFYPTFTDVSFLLMAIIVMFLTFFSLILSRRFFLKSTQYRLIIQHNTVTTIFPNIHTNFTDQKLSTGGEGHTAELTRANSFYWPPHRRLLTHMKAKHRNGPELATITRRKFNDSTLPTALSTTSQVRQSRWQIKPNCRGPGHLGLYANKRPYTAHIVRDKTCAKDTVGEFTFMK